MQLLHRIPLRYKITLGVAGFLLLLWGVGTPLANYMESRPEKYHATGVTGVQASIYSKPSLDSQVIATLDPLTNVDVVARKDGDANSVRDWYKIKINGKYGWVPDMIEYYTLEDFVANPSLVDYARLAERAGKSSEDFLLSALRTVANSSDRDEALRLLGNYNSEKVVDVLIDELDGRISVDAYLSLGKIARSGIATNRRIMEVLAQKFEGNLSCWYQGCQAEITDALVGSAKTPEDRKWLINFLYREPPYQEQGHSKPRWKAAALENLLEKQR